MVTRASLLSPVGAIVLLAACAASEPVMPTEPAATPSDSGLYPVENPRVDFAIVRPDLDISKFTQLKVDPLDVSNIHIIEPDLSGSLYRARKWTLTDAEKQLVAELYTDMMQKYLQDKGSYRIVDEAGANVLRISAALLEIRPNAPKDDFKSRPAGRTKIYTEGAGSMTIGIDFYDAQSGEILARMLDRRDAGRTWGENNRVTNRGEIMQLFASWARLLNSRLEKLQGKR